MRAPKRAPGGLATRAGSATQRPRLVEALGKPPSTSLAGLPLETQSSISRVLGGDLPGYQARAQGDGFAAGNGRHHVSARFTPETVELRSGNALWKLKLRSYGYGNALQPVSTAVPQARANRVEYRRGALTEWYVNGPVGLEQGFTLSERPGHPVGLTLPSFGLGSLAIGNSALTIALAVSGT